MAGKAETKIMTQPLEGGEFLTEKGGRHDRGDSEPPQHPEI